MDQVQQDALLNSSFGWHLSICEYRCPNNEEMGNHKSGSSSELNPQRLLSIYQHLEIFKAAISLFS